MSQSNKFDTGSARTQKEPAKHFRDYSPEPRSGKGGGLLLKTVLLAVVGAGFAYFLKSSAIDFSFISGQPAAEQERVALAAEESPFIEPAAGSPLEASPTAPPPEAPLAVAPLNAAAGKDPLAWTGNGSAPPSSSAEKKPTDMALPEPAKKDVVVEEKKEITMPLPEATPSIHQEKAAAMPAVAVPAVDKTAETVKAAAEGNAAAQAKIEALEKRLASLEEMVGKLQQDLSEKKSEEKAPEEHKAERKSVKKASVKKGGLKASHAVPPTVWILKAAKPGTGWVSKKGSSALRTVAVGDSLEGIGKITVIAKDSSGHWIVGGTKGRISQ